MWKASLNWESAYYFPNFFSKLQRWNTAEWQCEKLVSLFLSVLLSFIPKCPCSVRKGWDRARLLFWNDVFSQPSCTLPSLTDALYHLLHRRFMQVPQYMLQNHERCFPTCSLSSASCLGMWLIFFGLCSSTSQVRFPFPPSFLLGAAFQHLRLDGLYSEACLGLCL